MIRAPSLRASRSIPLIPLLTVLALSGCAAEPADDPLDDERVVRTEEALSRDKIVTRQGQSFVLEGKPFRFVGANVPQLVWQPYDQIAHELNYLEAAGVRVVRVFLPNNNCLTADPIIQRLRYVLDEAIKRDIRLHVALAHAYEQGVWGWDGKVCDPNRPAQHMIPGDEIYYVDDNHDGFHDVENGERLELSDAWVQYAYQYNYKPWVSAIVSQFVGHPGLFAWDIANEVRTFRTDPFWVKETIEFYRDMAAEIKSKDPSHLVSTGLISSHWANLTTDADKAAVYNDANIDFVSIHVYDEDLSEWNSPKWDDDIARANKVEYYNRPVVVGEFGKNWDKYPDYATIWREVTDFYARHYNPSDPLNVDAIYQFAVDSYEPDTRKNTGNAACLCAPLEQALHFGNPAIMRQYFWHWLTWAGELDAVNRGSTEPTKYVQSIWRGDREYQRRVPVVNGAVSWGGARDWVRVRHQDDMPGSGTVDAYDLTTYPSRFISEEIRRGGKGYLRYVPLNPGGMPNWHDADGWREYPGSYQARSDFVYPNDGTLMQSLWQNDVGQYRTVPIGSNGWPIWSNAGAWSTVGLSGLPGSGSLQAQDEIEYPNGQTVMQSIWRGDQGWYRTIPVNNDGTPNWGAASGWSGPIALSTLPGAGTLMGQSGLFTSHRR